MLNVWFGFVLFQRLQHLQRKLPRWIYANRRGVHTVSGGNIYFKRRFLYMHTMQLGQISTINWCIELLILQLYSVPAEQRIFELLLV